ncbi:N-acetylmuramic acid 6-phosphate etherase [Mollicutes bacterium LVI A0078]|nr:N-acetylmuramic acid 6-phosphate etherase [Mollicutes bacterium LVI A0075]WOO91415.1 N-acetylmuramic acid 6-phosphate etherase [Mollicutes bacterium LVI A0078]
MIDKLQTEVQNVKTLNLDKASSLEAIDMFYNEDKLVAEAVNRERESLSIIIDKISEAYEAGGRIIYVGAGNSGRLAMCDATECPPTFNVSPERVVAVVAGGITSLHSALESVEDSEEAAISDLEKLKLKDNDIIIGLSASGRTPYVKSALREYKDLLTIAISCNKNSEISEVAKYAVEIDVGPEVITGSTRLKAGTAQKMILNMISSIVMTKQGYVKQNMMINVKITNKKLMQRAINILKYFYDVTEVEAKNLLESNELEMRKVIKILEGE